MALNYFDTRFLTDLILQRKTPRSFLRNAFFNQKETTFLTKEVDFPFMDGKRRIATYIRRNEQSQYVEKIGYNVTKVKPGLISLSDSCTVDDLLNVQPGEVIQFSQSNPRDMAVSALSTQLMQFDDMITRAEELQCKQALFDAAIDLKDINGVNVVDQISYTRNADNTLGIGSGLTAAWTDNTNGRPLDDLDIARRNIQKHSGEMADVVVFGETAWQLFINHPYVKDQLDNRRTLSPTDGILWQMQTDGAVYRGNVRGFQLFSYDEYYESQDSTGTDLTPFVPAKKVLMGASAAKTERLYGAVDLIQEGMNASSGIKLYAAPRVADSWVRKDPDIRKMRLQSAPLMAMRQPDGYAVLTVSA